MVFLVAERMGEIDVKNELIKVNGRKRERSEVTDILKMCKQNYGGIAGEDISSFGVVIIHIDPPNK